MMQRGRGGMGSHKHGISGKSGKGPRTRLREKLEAEKNERKRRGFKTYDSVKEAFEKERPT